MATSAISIKDTALCHGRRSNTMREHGESTTIGWRDGSRVERPACKATAEARAAARSGVRWCWRNRASDAGQERRNTRPKTLQSGTLKSGGRGARPITWARLVEDEVGRGRDVGACASAPGDLVWRRERTRLHRRRGVIRGHQARGRTTAYSLLGVARRLGIGVYEGFQDDDGERHRAQQAAGTWVLLVAQPKRSKLQ
ncbi:hypothetical protein DFH09DRAFT_1082542 [Mycena vulgaris]|nr:hypothetical protein DFH09DRAFT_1082542 [Mycena vulgaris]